MSCCKCGDKTRLDPETTGVCETCGYGECNDCEFEDENSPELQGYKLDYLINHTKKDAGDGDGDGPGVC